MLGRSRRRSTHRHFRRWLNRRNDAPESLLQARKKASRAALLAHNSMKLTRQEQNSDSATWRGWHILTVAEAGFSMLDIYGRHHNGISIEAIQQFADRVNQTDESGTLYPRAPISAVPRRFFRELSSSTDPEVLNDFKRHLRDFLAANASAIHADRVLVDFHVSSSPVPAQYLHAAEEVFRDHEPEATLEEVVIFT